MENDELLRRVGDLLSRCEKNCELTCTAFLTPAEQLAVKRSTAYRSDCNVLFFGGHPDCERKAAFFLPYWLDAEHFDASEHISAFSVKAGFGEPQHRDYMGALLGLGIRREWLGDIWVNGGTATVFCLPSVEKHLLLGLDKVGRYGVKTAKLSLGEVCAPVRETKTVSFSVQSVRLDSVAAGMFHLSRTQAAERIAAGELCLNYEQCVKPDAAVHEGDVISLRGSGKGTVGAQGGTSKKGRIFISAEILK